MRAGFRLHSISTKVYCCVMVEGQGILWPYFRWTIMWFLWFLKLRGITEVTCATTATRCRHFYFFFVCFVCFGSTCRRESSSDASHSTLVLLLYAKKTKDNFHVIGGFILVSGSLCRCYITWHCSFSNIRVHFFNFSILDSPYTALNSSPQTQSSQDALTLMHWFCFIFIFWLQRKKCSVSGTPSS